jgi:hypothetical protein
LGRWGEARLAQVVGGAGSKPDKGFYTSLGYRFFDRLIDGVAHEAKAGLNVRLTSSIRRQLAKDVELIELGRIDSSHWHFFRGADPDLVKYLDTLSEKGISYTVH